MTRRHRVILRNRPLVPWLALLLGCAALAVAQWAMDRRQQRAWAAEQDFQARFDEIYRAVAPYSLQSPALVASGLNDGRPLEGVNGMEARPVNLMPGTIFQMGVAPRPAAGPRAGAWDGAPEGASAMAPSFRAVLPGRALGPRYEGWFVRLHFSDGALCGAWTVSPPHRAYAESNARVIWVEVLRPALEVTGAGLWCLCALLVPFHRHWRQPLARIGLASLVVAGTAWGLERADSVSPVPPVVLLRPLPLAAVAAVALTVAAALVPARRRKANGPIACAQCGYDLTGNESGICPECGRMTRSGRIDRWREQAEKIACVEMGEAEEAEEPEEVEEAAGGDVSCQTQGAEAA